MGKRAHCEVFRRHSDVPPFFIGIKAKKTII